MQRIVHTIGGLIGGFFVFLLVFVSSHWILAAIAELLGHENSNMESLLRAGLTSGFGGAAAIFSAMAAYEKTNAYVLSIIFSVLIIVFFVAPHSTEISEVITGTPISELPGTKWIENLVIVTCTITSMFVMSYKLN